MKQTLKRRICAAILCHILLLGLAGCGKANKAKPNDGGDPPVKASIDALKQGQPAADSEETVDGAESLARVRGDLEYDGRLTGAAAYLGLREKGDQTELTDWLRENCADLTSELPFLLEIPSERVLGAGRLVAATHAAGDVRVQPLIGLGDGVVARDHLVGGKGRG